MAQNVVALSCPRANSRSRRAIPGRAGVGITPGAHSLPWRQSV